MPPPPADLRLLDGVRIVAFATFLIGPAAVQYLADMGADVIKIEEPSRGPHERHWAGAGTFVNGVSAFFLMSNRNMRSVAIDLKSDAGRAAALDLCAGADVVVSNFRPEVMTRLGLDYATLSARKPDLIYASASGFGVESPYRHLPGQDLILQSMTGLAAMTGPAGAPIAAGAAVVDQHAAALLAMGILAALHHRQATGEGQQLETTMVQAALDLQSEAYALHLNGAKLARPERTLATAYHEAPYGFYAVSDGYIALSMSPIARISEALGGPPELAPYLDPTTAFSQRQEIADALAPLLTRFTRDDLLALLREHGIWCAPVNDYAEALEDPIVEWLDPVAGFTHPQAGEVRVVKHPITYGTGSFAVRQVPAELGEHTREVLAEAGYTDERIDALAREGVVRVV
ncbi:crotonobetainyl-CoA:carnitine CoA-transferase CaiB-like acyl-CoA transferase [Pseudonocardia hierapolitana]|uniref:Crotonobetainyl-CoA:carnitine CoA-transferase CaiB-like acyl-CoA transferase n=1 Tax=Pseudonocardia hierapolitana TaxID=1128676 RepID=A0A561SJF7_9PSEU|nr:CaiB/BaiF CoA-transferase family protein [Pseudonocardia hierapolitana]TWF75016.1 crotonobetainyl-CoA:carnitine CoA-transferase CaiB-like acyl-CoA transferase [Pseudonocardia hierapolitana]